MKSFKDYLSDIKNYAKFFIKWKYLSTTNNGDWLYRDFSGIMRVSICINSKGNKAKLTEIMVFVGKHPFLDKYLWDFNGYEPLKDFKKQLDIVKKEAKTRQYFDFQDNRLDSKKFVEAIEFAIKEIELLIKDF